MSREYSANNKFRNKVHGVLFLSLLLFAFTLLSLSRDSKAYAGQATLSWVAPSTNEDGTPLTDLAGYRIYYGTASGRYTQNVDAGNVTTYTFNSLADGQTYYFVATAYNMARFESSYSNEVSKIIPSSIQTASLSVTKTGTGSGVITSSPTGISCGSDCTEAYNSGASVILTASPDANSTFVGWSGACTGTGTCSIAMTAAKTVTANFTQKSYVITVSAGTGGSISPSGTLTVNYGGSQSFTVTPNTNYAIANVLVDGASAGPVTTYNFASVTANHTISASFTVIRQNTLNVTKTGSGTGLVTSTTAGISCGTDCSEAYSSGASIILTASPDASSTFAGWSGACTGIGTCTVPMNGSKNVTATFNLKTYSITATAGNGGSISPSGTININHGGSQTFTVTPNDGYAIADVVVDGSSAGPTTTYNFVNATGSHAITANFSALQQNSLNVTKTGTGAGLVTSSPAGISCGPDCSEVFTSGTVVTLTAVADAGSSFGGWSGACTGSGTCTVTMDGAKTASPLFQALSLTITATAGTGGSISPSGTVSVAHNGSQVFTIAPNPDYTIADVLVDGVSAGSVTSYSFTNVTVNHSINVSFAPNTNGNSSLTNIPRTGQTLAYASGDDGYIQAGVQWPALRFIDNGDGTITDILTGLMWLKNGGCIKERWKTASAGIARLNNQQGQYSCGYAGNYADWRLPTVNELKSLVNYGSVDSAQWLNSEGFVNMQSSYYWSGTSYLGSATKEWMITMTNGAEKVGSGNTAYILPVRIAASDAISKTVIYNPADERYIGEKVEWPAPRFNDNGDGTVTDSLTGLMWLKDAGCLKKRWNDSLNIIADFNTTSYRYACSGYTANYTDWRMPNIKELESMLSFGTSNPAGWLNSSGFTNVQSSSYWSSTSSGKNTSQAWIMNMKKSGKLAQNKKATLYTWPVRGGNIK